MNKCRAIEFVPSVVDVFFSHLPILFDVQSGYIHLILCSQSVLVDVHKEEKKGVRKCRSIPNSMLCSQSVLVDVHKEEKKGVRRCRFIPNSMQGRYKA